MTEAKLSLLQAKYCNAFKTHAQCGGHKKAASNLNEMTRHKAALIANGESVPSDEDASRLGEFNGIGAA